MIRRAPRSSAVLLMLAGVLLLLGDLGRPVHGQTRQETLIIARNIDDYTTNDPGRQYEFTGQMTNQSVYDTLVTVDAPDFTRVQPKLATKWDVSKDGTVYTFTLRPGVKFTSGNPLTAADVQVLVPAAQEPQGQPGVLPRRGEGDRRRGRPDAEGHARRAGRVVPGRARGARSAASSTRRR